MACCPLLVVSCTNENCQVTLARKNLELHATTTCQWRLLCCNHCNLLHPACKTEVGISICCSKTNTNTNTILGRKMGRAMGRKRLEECIDVLIWGRANMSCVCCLFSSRIWLMIFFGEIYKVCRICE